MTHGKFARCIVLARSPNAAYSLAREPDSPFILCQTVASAPPRGGAVIGVKGLHGYNSTQVKERTSAIIIAWNLHPNDHAIKLADMAIQDGSPLTVLKATDGTFRCDKRLIPVVTFTPHGVLVFAGRNEGRLMYPTPANLHPFQVPEQARALTGRGLSRTTLMAYVRKVAQRIGLNEALALAIVDEESHFNPQARNPDSGAAGLMQLMPSTIATLKVRDPFDPEESARAGLSLLNAYMHRFGDEREALAAYHSGRGALQSRGISTSDEIYIREVFAKKAVYERILHEALIHEGP